MFLIPSVGVEWVSSSLVLHTEAYSEPCQLLPCNPGQNIWNKLEKSSKTGMEKKSLVSISACF